jgi:hypothetical protein
MQIYADEFSEKRRYTTNYLPEMKSHFTQEN